MNAPVEQRVQAVACGGFVLGFAYGWARAALDMPTLTLVPNGPPWLLGAANLEGQIVPVVDLAVWLDSTAAAHAPPQTAQPSRNTHVLLGGSDARALALRFDGLPQPLSRPSHLPPLQAGWPANLPADLPPQLAAVALYALALPAPASHANTPPGISGTPSAHALRSSSADSCGNYCWELDPEALLDALIAELRHMSSASAVITPDHNKHNGAPA